MYLSIAGGLLLLVAGCEMLVRGAVSVARMLKISPFLIGLTLVAWGTSTPELLTSITAAIADAPGITVGNIVGTNIANILLILGLSAVARPVAIDPRSFRRDAVVVTATSLVLLALVIHGTIGRLAGAVMIAAVIAYAVHAYRADKARPAEHSAEQVLGEQSYAGPHCAWLAVALAVAGLMTVIFGAYWLVEGAIALARRLMVSETVIGLTIVAVGTSAPELTMGLLGAWRKQSGMAYANIIGSHVYNTLFILGFTALVTPIVIPPEIIRLDIWVMMAATALLVLFGWSGRTLSRPEGVAFVAAYAIYIWYMVTTSAVE